MSALPVIRIAGLEAIKTGPTVLLNCLVLVGLV